MRANYTVLRATAKEMFIKGAQQKEIAQKLNISTVSVSKWANEGCWKVERDARATSAKSRVENIHSIIGLLSEQQMELLKKIAEAENAADIEAAKELRKQSDGIADHVSKWNRTLKDIDKENRISLSVYLDVMDDIFRHLKSYDLELYHKTLDFQELHVHQKSISL